MTIPSTPVRHAFIDILRGISMIAVLSIHAMANYLGDPFVLRIWDLQQFAVQIFVFCSAYLFFGRPPTVHLSSLGAYLGKRVWRLYSPFLVFAACYFLLVAMLRPEDLTIGFIGETLLLVGGVDLTWLVLLFIQLMVSFQLLSYLHRHNVFLFRLAAAIIILSAILLYFFPFPYNWKLIMWLPWSAMGLFALWMRHVAHHRNIVRITYILSALLFLVFIGLQWMETGKIMIYPNKYPPNVIVLLYGCVWIGIFDVLHRRKVFERLRLIAPIEFFSKNSYSLFFLHHIVMYAMNNAFGLHKTLPWWGYVVVLFLVTMPAQLMVNQVFSILKNAKPA
ncbi:MAG: acyltransferase [Patescibacteria group bacterium]|nr:acyltransferase [Patescibacteria group bacterium]